MDQQERGPDSSQGDEKEPGQREADAGDSTWGLGSASALENLRRHGFRARRSKSPDPEEKPRSD
ncbi:hypothetical protein EZ313_13345 [Ramlibacter henchirensis]|uniref:Uncharacterized protein n=1 Tax=Ramlibacter henchirensis TaxID=204072 RepID=A0A4Z0BSJ8_9BURK|nr:hypothetical protein EZ313_13345 [Ramlibacter henchirensis]